MPTTSSVESQQILVPDFQVSTIMVDSLSQPRYYINLYENPKQLAAAFACSVTAPSHNHLDWVARNGGESLFQTLSRILPEVWVFPFLIFSKFWSFYCHFRTPQVFACSHISRGLIGQGAWHNVLISVKFKNWNWMPSRLFNHRGVDIDWKGEFPGPNSTSYYNQATALSAPGLEKDP